MGLLGFGMEGEMPSGSDERKDRSGLGNDNPVSISRPSGKKDHIEIPVGKFFSGLKVRENPWMLASVVLGVVLIIMVITSGSGGVTGSVISEGDAGQNVIDFINAQGQGTASIVSVDKADSFYEVVVDYDGQELPVFVTFDGAYLVVDPIPLAAGAGNSGGGVGGGTGGTGERVDVDYGDAPVNGDSDAPVTIIEFSDFECPFCASFYSETLPLIEENYIDSGDVKLVFMDFPLESIHPNARGAALAAECARSLGGDEAYFDMHDILFENQQDLNEENYKKWARELGLDGGEFDACYDSGDLASEVDSDLLYGSSLGVTGTPSFFIGTPDEGYLMISGAQPYSVFEQMIEAELTGLNE